MNTSTFSVKNNWLYRDGIDIPEIKSSIPKYSVDKAGVPEKNICDFIIMHYTASTTASSAHNNFIDPKTKVSWHLTIDQAGKVYQLYDFRKVTWHAGQSTWKNANRAWNGMNAYSIGIELVNPGPLSLKNGAYHTWSGQRVADDLLYFDNNGNAWCNFTQVQLLTAWSVASTLARQYKCIDILGHNQISPGRKQDPGPAAQAFMADIRSKLKSGNL